MMLFAQTHPEMTMGGWLFMVCSWFFILVLTFYTFAKILRKKP